MSWLKAKIGLGIGPVIVGIAVLAGLLLGFWVAKSPRSAEPSEAPTPDISLLGHRLPLGEQTNARALERIRRYARQSFTLRLPDDKSKTVTPSQLGVDIDKVRLAELIRDAGDRTSPLRRLWQPDSNTNEISLPVPLILRYKKTLPILLELKDRYDRLPIDARLDLTAQELVPEITGRWLDIDASVLAVQRALEQGQRSATVIFETKNPARLASELGKIEFAHVLGYFETKYDRSVRAKARTYNLRLAASKLDGTVLLPGEIFDFNTVVGPRDEANGYKVAPVIAQGELVDGIGGGTCQISGTLHGAAFFTGLEIVERYPHTRPSSYIKLGLDATVVYPTINFRIKNNFEFPVVLHQTVKNGRVRAEILGPERHRTVTMIRRIVSAIPYEEVERPDSSLPEATRILAQRGIPGFRLRRYRIVREQKHAIRQRWLDVYPPTTQIIRVGTGSVTPETTSAKDDPQPEYVADELLIMTQAQKEGGERQTSTRKKPGQYGQAGWTEEQGMPIWQREPDENDS